MNKSLLSLSLRHKRQTGSAIAESAVVLFVLFFAFMFPLIDLLNIAVVYSAGNQLNVDGVTTLFAGDPNGGILSNGLGTLDANGRATAVLTIPPVILQFLAGLPIYWNFLSETPAGVAKCVGDTKQMTLWP